MTNTFFQGLECQTRICLCVPPNFGLLLAQWHFDKNALTLPRIMHTTEQHLAAANITLLPSYNKNALLRISKTIFIINYVMMITTQKIPEILFLKA